MPRKLQYFLIPFDATNKTFNASKIIEATFFTSAQIIIMGVGHRSWLDIIKDATTTAVTSMPSNFRNSIRSQNSDDPVVVDWKFHFEEFLRLRELQVTPFFRYLTGKNIEQYGRNTKFFSTSMGKQSFYYQYNADKGQTVLIKAKGEVKETYNGI